MKINKQKIEAVIFDMDGVLINSEPFYVQSQKEIFAKLGLNISEEEQQTFQGTATDMMWETLKKKVKIPYTIEALVKMSDSNIIPYFESLKNFPTMPGVENLIHHLFERKIPLALASSSTPDVIVLVLEKTGFKKYFSEVVDSKMAGASKPEPDVFLLAAQKLGVLPENCLVVEDSTNGIKAAKTAGMQVVAFAGPGSEFQNQNNADWIISDFDELKNYLT